MAEANYSIKATIEANAKKFKSAIQAAKNTAERFKGTMAVSYTHLTLPTSDLV